MTPKSFKRRPKYAPTGGDTMLDAPADSVRTVTIVEPMFRALCLNSLRYEQIRKQHSNPLALDADIDRQIAGELSITTPEVQ